MKRLTKTREVILLSIIALFGLTFSATAKPSGEQLKLSVNLDEKGQQIMLIGGDMERSQDFLQDAANPQEISDWLYRDVNFSVCRVAYDKYQEMVEGEQNLAFYDKIIESMKMLRKSNPYVEFWATLRSDYDGYGNDNNLPDWVCGYPHDSPDYFFDTEKYARFLTDYIELLERNGVGLSYLATGKEWGTFITAEVAVETIKSIKKECAKRGVKVPEFVDPASWSIKQGVRFLKDLFELKEEGLFYGFSTHDLDKKDTSEYSDFVDLATKAGYPSFADESGYGAGGRTNGEEPETMRSILGTYVNKVNFYGAGMVGELIFEPHSRGVSYETRGIYFRDGEKGRRMRSYYAMKEFVNSVVERNTMMNLEGVNPENKSFVETSVASPIEGVRVMSFANDKELTLCVINNSEKPLSGTVLSVGGSQSLGGATMRMFDIDSDIQGVVSTPKVKKNRVTIEAMPAMSIAFVRVALK
ncbi:MAG: hypothetical protein R3Y16_04340 [Rikenellaceae bacterium]